MPRALLVALVSALAAAGCEGCAAAVPADGTKGEGEACADDVDCRVGLDCGADDVCAAVACDDDAACDDGAFCDDGECAANLPGGSCADDDNCVGGEVCLTGRCGVVVAAGEDCTGAAECAGGLVCDPATDECAGDVPCNAHDDCGAEAHCDDDGACAPSTDESPCDADAQCTAADRCFGSICIPDACEAEQFTAELVPPNVLIVLDRSGSMDQEIEGGASKWELAVVAVHDLLAAYADRIAFGLYLFPGTDQACDEGQECAPGLVAVELPAPSAQSIDDYLDDTGTCDLGTPISASLDDVVDYAPLEDAARASYVLLITDGEENCDADPADSVAELRGQTPEVKTFVVGFGDGVDPDQLDAMAEAGGTARAGDPKYFQADDAASLAEALATIAGEVLSCEYVVAQPIADPDTLSVYFDGARVPRDETHATGWDFAAGRLTFAGNACLALKTGVVDSLVLVYGCAGFPPQTNVDAGTIEPVDGGGAVGPDGGSCTNNDDCDNGFVCIPAQGCIPIGG
jgi:hypothetical protein